MEARLHLRLLLPGLAEKGARIEGDHIHHGIGRGTLRFQLQEVNTAEKNAAEVNAPDPKTLDEVNTAEKNISKPK